MITVREQALMLRMGERADYNRVFTRDEVKKFGLYKSEAGLSRALSNLAKHLLIERVGVENPRRVYYSDLSQRIAWGREASKRLDKTLSEMEGVEFKYVKLKPRKIEDVVRERIRNINRMRIKFRKTPKRGRMRYRLTEDGILFVLNLMEAEKWKGE